MSPRTVRRFLAFEQLEGRLTPATQAYFAGGVLAVVGDANANAITVSAAADGTLQVTDNGAPVPIESQTPSPTVDQTFLVIVYGLGGDDTITIDASLGEVSAALYGGDGNDT